MPNMSIFQHCFEIKISSVEDNRMERTQAEVKQLIEELKNLRIKEAQVITKLEATLQRTSTRSTKNPSFTTGERVFITNRIRKPVRWKKEWSAKKERDATVTGIEGERVHIRTDNGVETWRDAKNLRSLNAL